MAKEIKKIIPLDSDFMVKAMSDRVYGYLQLNSYCREENGEKIFFVYKKDHSIRKIGNTLKIPKSTVERKIGKLVEEGFVREGKVSTLNEQEEVDAYIFEKVEFYQKIGAKTLELLVCCLQEHVIKTYVYLLNKYENVGKSYEFSYSEIILSCFGVKSLTHEVDWKLARACIDMLRALGLLELEDNKVKVATGSSKAGCTYYFKIKKMHYHVRAEKQGIIK